MTTLIRPGLAPAARVQRHAASASAKTMRALQILKDAGQDGIGCSYFGAAMWGNEARSGRVSAVQGGGDYAAQMLLGRLRKRGLARINRGDGSSRWALTAKGALLLNPNESPWTQSVRRLVDADRGR